MTWALLAIATFFASSVQSATGFGFALIVVPAFLILLNSADAIQIVIIISVVMSCAHWLKLRHLTPYPLLKWLIIGGVVGFPSGIAIYKTVDLNAIKMAVAAFIILISLQNGWNLFRKNNQHEAKTDNKGILAAVGVVSGILGAAMAMPGPILMLYLSRTSLRKNEIRAAMMTFFVFAYSGALIMQVSVVGIETDTWITSAILLPAALIGVYAGHLVSNKINDKLFKGLVLIILILTGIFMILNL